MDDETALEREDPRCFISISVLERPDLSRCTERFFGCMTVER